VKKRIIWKLLGINILIIGFAVIIVWLAIDYLAADYLARLMEKYQVSPTDTHQMFTDAVHRYLIWATLASIALAVLLHFVLVKRVLGPLQKMIDITRKIAAGDYSARVPIKSQDEVGQLAGAFNRMADSLQQIEQLRKSMTIDVAHELRTPLTNIQGYLEALIDGVVSASRETYDLLLEETLRLVRLVEDILQLAKADAARADLQEERILLKTLIELVIDSFRSRFDQKNIGIEMQFRQPADAVRADPAKLTQVVRNLVQNAWEYTPAGGNLCISTQMRSREIRVVFSNTGEEIAEKDLPFIFERFFRGEKSRSRDHGGAGIGLAIVKELIEAHGGQVGAEISEGQTRVWFSLPASHPQA
jgi:two-component system sensor histidine kinase BaeS